jgi:LysM repeat protein
MNGVAYYVLDLSAAEDASSPTLTPTPAGQVIISTAGARGTEAVIVYVSTPLPNGETYHTVRRGEALWSIAIAYGITVQELIRLNGLAGDEIFEGQILQVQQPFTPTPMPSSTPPGTATLGIPTSTPTSPATLTATSTPTPVPVAPATFQSGALAVGMIVLAALLSAWIGAVIGGRRAGKTAD